MKIIQKNISPKQKSQKYNFYEKISWAENKFVLGVDEVGRGCLAGPVVTAAVILKPNAKHKLLKDSKILTKKELLIAYDWIKNNSTWSVSFLDNNKIDQVNIYQATLLAMKRSVTELLSKINIEPQYILVDAMPLKITSSNIEIFHFNFGESLSASIAAASIVAKVTRDNLMQRINKFFPGYELDKHKGYSTPEHKNKIYDLGSSIIHRKSFLKNMNCDLKNEDNQTSFLSCE